MANNDDKTVEFSVTKNKTAVNSEGIKQDNIPLPFNEAYCGEFSNNIPEPSGSTGWTLAPRQHMWTNNDQMERDKLLYPLFSTNGNYQVQINARLLKYPSLMDIVVSSAAHELYGHTLFMFDGKDALHRSSRTGSKSNEALEKWIKERSNEAVVNNNNKSCILFRYNRRINA